MCGIFAVINEPSNNAAQTVLEGLKKLEYRGYDSWGIALIPETKNILSIEKHVGKIGLAKTVLPAGSMAIGHTRWATHGGVTDVNSHPHTDCTGRIAVIHNGIVENYQSLKSKLFNLGHIFTSETDTEVIAHLIEEETKKLPFHLAVFKVFNQLVGSNAIVAIDLTTKTIVGARNGSPLAIGTTGNQSYLASDITAFLNRTSTIRILQDGEGIVMTSDKLSLYNLHDTKSLPLKFTTTNWHSTDTEINGFPHFLLKEIFEQVTTIPKTATLDQSRLMAVSTMINAGYKVIIIGCGTAYYCGLIAKYFLAREGIEAQIYGAYEFLPFNHFCNKNSICIAISQSGETADTLVAAKTAKALGAHLVAVVNAPGSTLEQLADTVLNVGAGPEIAVVSTKAFTSQLATLYLLSQACAGKLKNGQTKIKQVGHILALWLTPAFQNKIISLAKILVDSQDMYLIGKHLAYPSALEFALKIKETSYIHAEAFASGELKHGVITLIQTGTPCFVLMVPDESSNEVLSSAAQLKARGGTIIGIGVKKSSEFKYFIKVPNLGDLTIFPLIIVGQLLGYYLGVGRGADPDKPRNLAKSVTVK